MAIDSSEIERSHRLGAYRPNRNRPIIVKFISYKTKKKLLLASPELKGSAFLLSEDFSPTVRSSRARLLNHGRHQAQPFKLRFNKLHSANSLFMYDSESKMEKH